MTEVIMPKMGDAMEEGTLVEWLKREGEKVKSGEVIGTIQTDKATLELEAPGSGVLSCLLRVCRSERRGCGVRTGPSAG